VPTYEYMCEKCEHEFEREQRISDPPVKTCPQCRSRKVKKLISRTSFVLKGSGWYSDLYASPRSKDGGEAKSEGRDSKQPKSESSTEKKTESVSSDSKKAESKSSKASSSSASKKGKSAA
jgi:putative FmdB family regulatory protein